MTADLKPCPFCGGAAYFERTGTRRQSCIVACSDCGARHESSDEDERSGQSWNRRVPARGVPASEYLAKIKADPRRAAALQGARDRTAGVLASDETKGGA